MSHEKRIEAVSGGLVDASAPDDLRVQIELRLKPDDFPGLRASVLPRPDTAGPTREDLCRLACRMYEARRTRDKMLDRELFGEPAWDMLLALYCLGSRGERLGVTALSLAADVPQTTGMRWQKALIAAGLVQRETACDDARLQILTLTKRGREQLEDYFVRLITAGCRARGAGRL